MRSAWCPRDPPQSRTGACLSSLTAAATKSGESRVPNDPDWVGRGSGFAHVLVGVQRHMWMCRGLEDRAQQSRQKRLNCSFQGADSQPAVTQRPDELPRTWQQAFSQASSRQKLTESHALLQLYCAGGSRYGRHLDSMARS